MRCFHSQINFKCKVLSKTQVTRLCAFYILFIMIICTLKIASPRTPGAVTAPPPTAAAVGVAVSTQVTGELFQLEFPWESNHPPMVEEVDFTTEDASAS